MFFPRPDDIELKDWSDGVVFALINYPGIWWLSGDDWQQWGMLFFMDPYLSRYDPPDPYQYQDWREWARKLADSMTAVPGSPVAALKKRGILL